MSSEYLQNMGKKELVILLKELQKKMNASAGDVISKGEILSQLEKLIDQNEELSRNVQELENSVSSYADLYNFAPVGYLTLNKNTHITEINFTASAILANSKKNLLGMPFLSFVSHKQVPLFLNYLNGINASSSKQLLELELSVPKKGKVDIQFLAHPVIDYNKHETLYRVVITDRTERRKLEKEVQAKQDQLSAIFNQVIVGIVQVDRQGNFLMVNKRFCEITGRTEEELLKMSLKDITHPDDLAGKIAVLNKLSPENPHATYEKRYVRPDGKIIWVHNSLTLVTPPGMNEMAVVVVEDITKRRAAEEALKESEVRFKMMADTTPAFVWMTDGDGNMNYMNKTRLDFCGCSLEDNLGDKWQNFIHPDDIEKVVKLGREVNRKRERFQHEYRLRSADGKYRWILDEGMPRFTSEGEFAGFIGSGVDITEIKKAEQKLKASFEVEKQLRIKTEEYAKRQAFIAETSIILNSSLDYSLTLKSVAQMATPEIADWCVVDLYDENQIELKRVAVSHVDPEKVKFANLVEEKYPSVPTETTGVWNVLRTGRSELYKEIPDELLKKTARNEEHYNLLLKVGFKSVMFVPLKIRDKIFGIITLIYADSGRHYNEDDLAFVEDIASRAALAIDNARLYNEAQQLNLKLEEQIYELHDEMAERLKARRALQLSEEKFKQLAENIKNVFYIIDSDTRKFEYLSPAFETIWGIKADEMLTDVTGIFNSIHPDDRERVVHEARQKLFTEEYAIEFRIIRPDNNERWIFTKSFPVKNDKGKIYRIVGISEDITQRKLAEEQIRNSLKEKEVLLREIHHRVKNNLQIISSLLSLQTGNIKDKQDLEVFIDSQNRVRSMALVHEKLYQRKDLSGINFAEYVNELIEILKDTYRSKSVYIDFNIDVQPILLNVDISIGLGLIINELISNAFKHAFPGDMTGEICVSLKTDKKNTLTVKISDNGIGIPENIDFKNTESLGLQLVTTLTDQHWGKIELTRNGGTSFKITFPELRYRQ